MAERALRFSFVALTMHLLLVTADFTENCPPECKCGWASGSRQADCSRSNFQEIPSTLTTEIQILKLTGNNIHEITNNAFQNVGLINLKQLILRECNLTKIDKNALSGLSIMVDLDLSRNNLKTLHAGMFEKTPRIRRLLLNDNQLEQLEDGLFNNIPLLRALDLSNNFIAQFNVNTFMNMPKLESLKLNGNKLEQLEKETLSVLTSIYLLVDFSDNPWRCDCNLQPLVTWVKRQSLSSSPVVCKEPAQVRGKLWNKLVSSDFACEIL